MMLGWIGALLGIAASVRPREDLQASHDRLASEVEQLAHERELLRNHIDLLEREVAVQRAMADHWLKECQAVMRDRRLIEDDRDRLRDLYAPQYAQMAQAQMQQAVVAAQIAQYDQMQAHMQSQPQIAPYDILRNCSPGRHRLLAQQFNEALGQ